MKKALVATFVLALVVGLAPSSAGAFAARTSSASADGLRVRLTGSDLIPFTPTVTASQPPDTPPEGNREAILPLDLDPLDINATGLVRADAHRADNIQPIIVEPGDNERVTLGGVNARGYATLEVNDLLLGVDLPAPLPELNLTSLLAADAIEAEAVAKCVVDGTGRRPPTHAEFDTGYNIVGLELADGELTPVEDLVDTILQDLLGTNGALAAIIAVDTPGTDPTLIQKVGDTISVTALRVRVLPLGGGTPLLEVAFGRASATMPTPCRPPECEDLVDNDGDGKIDHPNDPGCDSPQDDNEDDAQVRTGAPPALAATGGDMGLLPVTAFGALGLAVIVRRMALRSARRTS